MKHKKPNKKTTKTNTKTNNKKQNKITYNNQSKKQQPLQIKTKPIQKTIRTTIIMQKQQMQKTQQKQNQRKHNMQNMTLNQRKILNKITTSKPQNQTKTNNRYRCKQITKNSQPSI